MKVDSLAKKIIRKLISLSERAGNRLKATPLRDYFLGRVFVDTILLPSDLYKIQYTFKGAQGRSPNILFPQSFNEKLQRSKLTKRRQRYTQYADKIAVRDFVSRSIGEQYLTRLLWHGTTLDGSWASLNSTLPDKFIIKTNQGSGSNIICMDKSIFNWPDAATKVSLWLKNDHSIPFAEWQYRWIKPQVLVEELLLDSQGKIPVDYKFFCFNGKPFCIQVDFDRALNHTRLLFDLRFRPLDVTLQYPKYQGAVEPPVNLDLMTKLAEKLSVGEEFIRVDFYEVAGKVLFGELTLHPEAGLGLFNPPEFDMELGKLMDT